jgi:hypothetical protein
MKHAAARDVHKGELPTSPPGAPMPILRFPAPGLVLLLMFAATAATATAATSDEDRALAARMDRLHILITERFIHPQTQMFYDYVPPMTQSDRWGHLPTAEEMAAGRPNRSGWGTGMEDGGINGGAWIATLIDAHAATGEQRFADDARRFYQGLRLLWAVPTRKGFIARCIHPDGKSHYSNTSVDQVTFFVYGLWRYYHSAIASDAEKAEMRTIMHDVCTRIEEDGFDVLQADGKPALVGDIGVVRSDRSSRLLEVFRVGADLTGQAHWLALYRELASQNGFARMRDVVTPSRVDRLPWGSQQTVYGILQNHASILPLLALETDLTWKAVWLEALRLDQRLVESRWQMFRQYDPARHSDDYTLGNWRTGGDYRSKGLEEEYRTVRIPCEAAVVMLQTREAFLVEPASGVADRLYADHLKNDLRAMLMGYDYERMRTFCMLYAEWAYWLAVRQEIFSRPAR